MACVAWQVCGRLFCHDAAETPQLKHLTAEQVRSFRANGFLVVDGFLGAQVSAALRQETLALHDRGAPVNQQLPLGRYDHWRKSCKAQSPLFTAAPGCDTSCR